MKIKKEIKIGFITLVICIICYLIGNKVMYSFEESTFLLQLLASIMGFFITIFVISIVSLIYTISSYI